MAAFATQFRIGLQSVQFIIYTDRYIQHARKYIEVTIESFFHAKSGKMFESKRSANFGCASKTRLTIKGRITEFAIQSVVKCR